MRHRHSCGTLEDSPDNTVRPAAAHLSSAPALISWPRPPAERTSAFRCRVAFEFQDGDVLALKKTRQSWLLRPWRIFSTSRPRTQGLMWWVACYQLGNLHRPARFLEEESSRPLIPWPSFILKGFGVDIERVKRPFVGRSVRCCAGHHDHEPMPILTPTPGMSMGPTPIGMATACPSARHHQDNEATLITETVCDR